MRTFDRYLLSQLLVLFGFFSLVLVSVYWVNRAVVLFEQLIGDGQSALVFLEFTALALPNVIRLVLPVSAFAATVYAINRLTSESELVVVQAMGFSNFRLARPVLVFGLFVSLLVLVLNHFLVPASRAELSERRAEIAQDNTSKFLTEGQFLHPSKGITFYIGSISQLGELQDVYLSDATDPTRRTTYTAKRALLVPGKDGPTLIMFEGTAQTLRQDTNSLSTTSFEDSVYDIASLTGDVGPARVKVEELPTSVLLAASPELLALTKKGRAVFLYEAHARFAQPFLAVAGALIGFSCLLLGAFSRFGVWRQILLAIFLLICLQMIDNAMADVARRSQDAWPYVYVAPVAGTCVAMVLLWISERSGLFRRRRSAAGVAA